jgi:hypothetical protein
MTNHELAPVPDEPWETQPGWEQQVVSPLLKYPLKPREAHLLLQVAGQLVAKGVSVSELVGAVLSTAPAE